MPDDSHLDPDAPDLMGGVADRYLTAEGFAYRLLRLILLARQQRREVRDVLADIEVRCRALAERPDADER